MAPHKYNMASNTNLAPVATCVWPYQMRRGVGAEAAAVVLPALPSAGVGTISSSPPARVLHINHSNEIGV